MGNLPPLELLMPFEASARLCSFTRAAEELSVTQSAVSQRVRSLETLMETRLFLRHHRAIELTEEGRELFNGVKVALQHLRAASESIRQREERPLLRLAVDTSVGALWLVPRLQAFLESREPLAVDLVVSDDPEAIRGADVSVMHGDGDWPGFVARKLFADEVFPVCAPAYLERYEIRTAEDLRGADLIDLDYKQWNWMNWGIWLTEVGLDPTGIRIGLRTNAYPAKIDAARAGLGVALGWRDFVEDDLRSGRLVRPVPEHVTTPFAYYVLLRHGAGESAHWLAKELYGSARV